MAVGLLILNRQTLAMELGWSALAMMIVAAAAAWFWQNSLAARERANSAAMEACERLRLQFLDGTVAFARIAVVRDRGGRLAWQRTYVFDYTANSIERRQGFVVMTALRIESIGYAAGEESRAAAPAAEPGAHSNVLAIADWRAPDHQHSGHQRSGHQHPGRHPPGRSPERHEDRDDDHP